MSKYVKETTYEERHERHLRKPNEIINTNFNIKKHLIRGTEQQKQNAKEDNTIEVKM